MFVFSTKLNNKVKDELERIMFFNAAQKRYQLNIIKLIELYGEPRIIEKNDELHLALEKVDCQSLFVTKNEDLVGVMVFRLNSPEDISLVHVAVNENYSYTGIHAGERLVYKMIEELKKIASMIKGVNMISFHYGLERINDRNAPHLLWSSN